MAKIEVRTEIAGLVAKIEAKKGDRLTEDAPILLLESMKMEIPVSAPVAGALVEILVVEGDSVREGDTVAVIEA